MLKLKLQYFGHLMRRADSLRKTLMMVKIEDRSRRGWHRMRWQTLGESRGQKSQACCNPWGCRVGHD